MFMNKLTRRYCNGYFRTEMPRRLDPALKEVRFIRFTKCRKCIRFLAGPASKQEPPYPQCRVTSRCPFEATGMDLGGPIYLKDNSKVWFVVFTCILVRAIHLEPVTSLSAEVCIQALQRFMNRRGVPQLCISDH